MLNVIHGPFPISFIVVLFIYLFGCLFLDAPGTQGLLLALRIRFIIAGLGGSICVQGTKPLSCARQAPYLLNFFWSISETIAHLEYLTVKNRENISELPKPCFWCQATPGSAPGFPLLSHHSWQCLESCMCCQGFRTTQKESALTSVLPL